MVAISRRSFKMDVEGRAFVCRELSHGYIKNAQDGGEDTALLAVQDSVGVLTEEDFAVFGKDTIFQMYEQIVRFTFEEPLTAEDRKHIEEKTGLSEEEVQRLSRTAKEELKALLQARERDPQQEEKAKKPSLS